MLLLLSFPLPPFAFAVVFDFKFVVVAAFVYVQTFQTSLVFPVSHDALALILGLTLARLPAPLKV